MSLHHPVCGCASGEEPQHFRIGGTGEVQCTICGWVWVRRGWNEGRLCLFADPDSVPCMPESATPTIADLQRWFRAGAG